VILGQLVVIDTEDHSEIGAVGGRGNQHALGACGQGGRSLVFGGEKAGALQGNVDAEILSRQVSRVSVSSDFDVGISRIDCVAFNPYLAGETAVYAVVAEQMCVGFDRSEVVNGDDLDILPAGFGDGAQDVAADAAKPVNGNTHCHFCLPARGAMYHDTYS